MAFALQRETDRARDLFALMNPVNHGATPERIATDTVEPYVVAPDIYAVDPHRGRDGWTWYTGSAGWRYRLFVETPLGANLEGGKLRLTPRLPKAWPSYKIHYRYRQPVYHLTVARLDLIPPLAMSLTLDGHEIDGTTIPLLDERRENTAELRVR